MNKEWKVSKHSDLAHWDRMMSRMDLLLHLMTKIREMTNNKSYFDDNCGKDINGDEETEFVLSFNQTTPI